MALIGFLGLNFSRTIISVGKWVVSSKASNWYSPDLENESEIQICMEKSDLNFQLSNQLKKDLKNGELLNLFEDIIFPHS